jgi:hypothetical protein
MLKQVPNFVLSRSRPSLFIHRAVRLPAASLANLFEHPSILRSATPSGPSPPAALLHDHFEQPLQIDHFVVHSRTISVFQDLYCVKALR